MIKINHADKYYNRGSGNELHVMNNVTLELPESGMIAIFGKSGCGKTTLLNAIGGLDRINSGEITVFGENIAKNTDYIRNKYIGYIFQNYNLSKNETVFENVADALRLCGITDADDIYSRVVAALKNVGMDKFKNRLPDTLSGGQQQRVAIARALVKNPAIILADEPTGNLDETNTIMIMNILKQVSRDHLVLLVTHEAHLVDYYCDRVIEIVDGKINSVRDNAEANGYSSRSKNDIYLGELSHRESEIPGVSIEYYGEAQEEIKLRIVSVNGKIYLKSDTPQLKILDDSSEIKLKEGTFVEKDKTSDINTKIDMSELKPIEGKDFGRLFSFGSSVVSGYRENFSKKSKKGRKLLRISMILLAFVVVFMSASFAVSIRSLSDIRKDHNDSIFYLPLLDKTDTSAVIDHLGEHGIDYARVVGGDYLDSADYIQFKAGSFMTANVPNTTANGNVLDAKLSEKLPLVCGTRNFANPLDVIITTAVADELIKSNSASYINSYSDLLNMVSMSKYDGENYMRITGVVESDEKNFYLNSLYATYVMLQNQYYGWLTVVPASIENDGSVLERGSVKRVSMDGNTKNGVSVTIMGKKYTVSDSKIIYTDSSMYKAFLVNEKQKELSEFGTYYDAVLLNNPTADEFLTKCEWLFEYYLTDYKEFLGKCSYIDEYQWAYLDTENIAFLLQSIENTDSDINMSEMYAAYRYKQSNGVYPTERQYYEYIENNDTDTELKNELAYTQNENFWQRYNEYSTNNGKYSEYYIMNDEDYTALAYTTGVNDSSVCQHNMFETYGSGIYNYNLLIHADNPDEAAEYLKASFGDNLITPKTVFDETLRSSYNTIVGNLISLAVLLALICLCVYFIMRSSLMSRVKEIGIYRAIGVSKKNLTFRFMIESLVLTTMSLLIGYIVASVLVMRFSTMMVLSDVFYFPIWLAALILVILYAVTVIFGTLPVRMLLRKTPSEILAKYDI